MEKYRSGNGSRDTERITQVKYVNLQQRSGYYNSWSWLILLNTSTVAYFTKKTVINQSLILIKSVCVTKLQLNTLAYFYNPPTMPLETQGLDIPCGGWKPGGAGCRGFCCCAAVDWCCSAAEAAAITELLAAADDGCSVGLRLWLFWSPPSGYSQMEKWYNSLDGMGQFESYRVSPAIWDHTALPATRYRWTCPTITQAIQAGTWFIYHGGEGWVDLGVGYMPRWFACPQTGSGHMVAIRVGVEPTTSWS